MASHRTQRTLATALSVPGHAALVALLTIGLPQFSRERASVADGNPIETAMVDPNAVLAELARLEEAEAEELRLQQEAIQKAREEAEAEEARIRELERQRQQAEEQAELERQRRDQEREEAERVAAAEQLRLEQEAEAERIRIAELEAERLRQEELARQEDERRREEELARQREEEERQRQEELARQREEEERLEAERLEAERQAAIQRQRDAIAEQVAAQVAAEEADRLARESGLLDQWIRAIENRVTARWNQPPNVGSDLDCVLEVTQLPDGTVTAVAVTSCNTNDANIIRSLENAVMSASPLPRRPEGVAYARVIKIRFNPTE